MSAQNDLLPTLHFIMTSQCGRLFCRLWFSHRFPPQTWKLLRPQRVSAGPCFPDLISLLSHCANRSKLGGDDSVDQRLGGVGRESRMNGCMTSEFPSNAYALVRPDSPVQGRLFQHMTSPLCSPVLSLKVLLLFPGRGLADHFFTLLLGLDGDFIQTFLF